MVAAMFMLPVAALGSSADGDDNGRDWTVLMYFGADNDLYQATEFGFDQAWAGLQESEVDRNALSVVVLIDGPKEKDTKVWELTSSDKYDKTFDAFGSDNVEKTMTSEDTMVEFLCWGMSTYQSTNTMLVLKNGHAWCGILPEDETDVSDETSEKILMPIEDIASAIGTVYDDDRLDDPWIDVIVFDGDNMGSIEVAYELRTVTSYFVGSQQQVPLEGLPYFLFMRDLGEAPDMEIEDTCEMLVDNYVLYYNNTDGKKDSYPKLITKSRMYVTAAVFEMGVGGEKIEAAVKSFDNFLDYMLKGVLPDGMFEYVDGYEYEDEDIGLTTIDAQAKLDQWMCPDPTSGEDVWAWIPLNRNNIASARDCALIGKMSDQQGYEWLPDVYTWLRAISALVNYETYGDPVPPSGDVPPEKQHPPLNEFVDPFIRLLFEDFMDKFGYEEQGISRAIFYPEYISGEGTLVYLAQSQILDRSGNSFPHGLNIWFPPSWLQWDELEMLRERTYVYAGVGVTIDGTPITLPAEYYCVDCPTAYDQIGLDFTSSTVTSWMDFFEVYYDSRWLIYGPGSSTGARSKL